ncbi:c2 domain-containing protein [Anaeramoeba flamelloides]|uniref:C2 domain-containing protein n=1 Tax=Anaeramoeba flamelloides TaxID=1746091 RepID=A0AAV7ZJ03_9EUKA|nr:c2 domain-containing protein [Anaeramoeba flamelloides]KAJ6235668.1 c2 domain-containing protein [Anaeramoeba flamelloides]
MTEKKNKKSNKKKEDFNLNGKLYVRVVKAQNLPPANRSGDSDPFVIYSATQQCSTKWEFDSFYQKRTSVIKNDLNPEWKDGPQCFIIHKPGKIIFDIYDYNIVEKRKLLAVGEFIFQEEEQLSQQGMIFPIPLKIKLSKEEIKKNSKNVDKKKKKNKNKKAKSVSNGAKLWVDLRFEPYNKQIKKEELPLQDIIDEEPNYKIFRGETVEEAFKESCQWLNDSKEHGVQVLEMKNGISQEGSFYIAILFRKLRKENKNFGYLFPTKII